MAPSHQYQAPISNLSKVSSRIKYERVINPLLSLLPMNRRHVIYGILALLLSVFYLTRSLELDEEEYKAHYSQEQISTLCTAAPVYTVPTTMVVALLPVPIHFHSAPNFGVGSVSAPALAFRFWEPPPLARRFRRLCVLRL